MRKYGLANFYLTKSLKYLSKDGKQRMVPSIFELITNHTSQKKHEILFNIGLTLYNQKDYK